MVAIALKLIIGSYFIYTTIPNARTDELSKQTNCSEVFYKQYLDFKNDRFMTLKGSALMSPILTATGFLTEAGEEGFESAKEDLEIYLIMSGAMITAGLVDGIVDRIHESQYLAMSVLLGKEIPEVDKTKVLNKFYNDVLTKKEKNREDLKSKIDSILISKNLDENFCKLKTHKHAASTLRHYRSVVKEIRTELSK